MTENEKKNPLADLSFDELVQFDPVDIVEKARADGMLEDPQVSRLGMLGLFAAKQSAINKKMEETGDIKFGSNIDQALAVAKSLGFEIVRDWAFQGHESDGSFKEEKDAAYFVPKGQMFTDRLILLKSPDPMILLLETYWGGISVNTARLHFAGEFGDRSKKPYGLSGMSGNVGVWYADVRQALKHMVGLLRKDLKFCPRWREIEDRVFGFYLRNYQEWKTADNGEGIESARIQELPQEIKDIIGAS